MEFERINKICPVCGSGNFMMLMKGENVCKRNVKCINCNHYFIYDALRNNDGQIMNNELRSCPFCGGKARIVQADTTYGGRPTTIQNGYKVGCDSCKIYTPVFNSAVWVDEEGSVHADKNGAEDAATLWNRRANDGTDAD